MIFYSNKSYTSANFVYTHQVRCRLTECEMYNISLDLKIKV